MSDSSEKQGGNAIAHTIYEVCCQRQRQLEAFDVLLILHLHKLSSQVKLSAATITVAGSAVH